MKLFLNINWIELSDAFQKSIIDHLLESFNKEKNKFIIDNIIKRFTKKTCTIWLYIENFTLSGICISWKCNKYTYLDKFFIVSNKKGKGIGSNMLNEFISENKDIYGGILWRTDTSTSKFYLNHPNVIKYFETKFTIYKNEKYIHSNYEKPKVYLGTVNKIWEYEDIYDLKLETSFTIIKEI